MLPLFRDEDEVDETVKELQDWVKTGRLKIVVLGRNFSGVDVTFNKDPPVCEPETIPYSEICRE